MISIDEAIISSERRAKRFWLISILWIIIMLATTSIIGVSLYQFSKTQREINELKITADRLVAELEKTKEGLNQLKRTGSAQSKQIYALSLLTVGPDKLTPEQKEFIKRQADDASSQLPTPASLTVQAFSEFIRGQYQGSYDTYTEALSLQSDFNQAYEGRATVDWYLENFPKAYEDFSQALKFDSGAGDRPALLARRAEVLLKLGKLEEAEQDLEEANHSNEPSNKAIVLNAQGLIKIKKQDWQGAEMDFRTAADLEPNQAQARLENIGIVYLLEANWTAAYEWSMKTSKMPRSGEWFWMIEALAAEKLGKSQERRAAVQEFIENNRDPKQSVRALSFYLSDDLAQLGKSWVPEAVK